MTFFKRRKEKKVGSTRRDTAEISLFVRSSRAGPRSSQYSGRDIYVIRDMQMNTLFARLSEISYEARFRTRFLHCLCACIASDVENRRASSVQLQRNYD